MTTNPIILTRRQFEAIAYGWNLYTSATNLDMLQLVEMGYLRDPKAGLFGAVRFETTEAGNVLGDHLRLGEIVLTIAAKEQA